MHNNNHVLMKTFPPPRRLASHWTRLLFLSVFGFAQAALAVHTHAISPSPRAGAWRRTDVSEGPAACPVCRLASRAQSCGAAVDAALIVPASSFLPAFLAPQSIPSAPIAASAARAPPVLS